MTLSDWFFNSSLNESFVLQVRRFIELSDVLIASNIDLTSLPLREVVSSHLYFSFVYSLFRPCSMTLCLYTLSKFLIRKSLIALANSGRTCHSNNPFGSSLPIIAIGQNVSSFDPSCSITKSIPEFFLANLQKLVMRALTLFGFNEYSPPTFLQVDLCSILR